MGVWLGLWLAPEADGRLPRDRVRLLRWAGPVGLAWMAEVIEAVGDRWTDGPVDVMVDDIDAPDRAAITAGTDSSGSP